MIGSLKNNELERKRKQSAWCNLWHYRENRQERIRKVMKISIEDSRLPAEISTGRIPYTYMSETLLFKLTNKLYFN